MKHLFLILFLSASFYNTKASTAGCNFGMTNSVSVGSSWSFTVGQGNWGPRKYTWDFGDGTSNISYSTPANNVYMSHTYTLNGVYSMTISAQDSLGGGCLSSMIYTLTVTSATCQAAFSYSVDTLNCKVQFTNQSSSATSFSWYFSNGNSISATSPSVAINNQSAITVTLIAFNSSDQCDVDTLTIPLVQSKCYTVGMKKTELAERIVIIQKREDEIEITLDETLFNSLSVIDTKGIVVKRISITTDQSWLSTSEFSSGIYYLVFSGNGAKAIKKIIR